MDQQIIFGPDNRSTGSTTTWAVERIPRELGLTCNTRPNRITAENMKNGDPVGLYYSATTLVKCLRVVVTLTVTSDQGSCYINIAVIRIVLHWCGRDMNRVTTI